MDKWAVKNWEDNRLCKCGEENAPNFLLPEPELRLAGKEGKYELWTDSEARLPQVGTPVGQRDNKIIQSLF